MSPTADSATRAVAGDVGQLEEWRVHHLLVDELLGLMEKLLALTAVHLHRLSLDEILDVRVRPIGEEAARCHERVEPGRRVAEGGACALDDLLEPLIPVLLEEGPALHRPNRGTDANRPEVAGHRLGEGRVR